jgi:hypothetical protein
MPAPIFQKERIHMAKKYIVYHSIIIDLEGNTHQKGEEVDAELIALPRMVDIGAVYEKGVKPPDGVDVNITPMTPGKPLVIGERAEAQNVVHPAARKKPVEDK